MTKALTEQWREGTLKEGFYYILFASRFGEDYITIDMFISDEKDFMYSCCEDVKEVLAPVPSYDHFSQLGKKVERLQEQLKEANEVIRFYKDTSLFEDKYNSPFNAIKYLKKWGVK